MAQILLEIKSNHPIHGEMIYQGTYDFHDQVLSLPESEQKEVILSTWKSMDGDAKLIAFHIPVTTWKRAGVEQEP